MIPEPVPAGDRDAANSGGFRLEHLWRDLRFSVRSLRRSPGFSLAVIITLALCVGANVAIFSAVYAFILKPLPFRDPGQLVEVYNAMPKNGQFKRAVSVAQYTDYKRNADLFDVFTLWRVWPFILGEETGTPVRRGGARVSADLFKMLEVEPLMGRFFTIEESAPGSDHITVLTESFWESHFQSDPDIVGKTIRLSGLNYEIIGVAPRRVERFNRDSLMFKPYEWNPRMESPAARTAVNPEMYARIKSGVRPEVALAQLASLEQRYYTDVASPALREFLDRGGHQVILAGVRAEQIKSIRSGLIMLQIGALVVLLLACVNVTSLMLARANVRQGELALRQALGAGRVAVTRQLLTESFVLSAAGATAGVLLAWSSLGLINSHVASILYYVHPVSMDPSVLALTLAGAFAIASVIGLLPVVRIWRTNLAAAFQGGRGSSSAQGRRALSSALVICQVAMAMMLLVAAGLLLKSFARVLRVDLGFDSAGIVHARTQYTANYPDIVSRQAAQGRIVAAMRAIPGVSSVAICSHLPMQGQFNLGTIPLRGSTLGENDTHPSAAILGVTPEFFDLMGIKVLEGRAFTEADQLRSRRVFIVDRTFAERHFPGRSAVGEGLGTGAPNQPPDSWPVIIGVVENAKFNGPDGQEGLPFAYTALNQGSWGGYSLLLKTQRPFVDVLRDMRTQLRTVDPALPLYTETTIESAIHDSLRPRRGVLVLLGVFALIALLLSAVGIYGMLAYDVTQRTREIGIRGAIGASRGQISGLILKQGLRNALIGLGLGLVGALALTRYLSSQLYDIAPTDPLSFLGVSLLLLAVALLACWLPARRAAKIDPIIALRAE